MPPLDELMAAEAIRKVKALYFRAMDTKQWDLLDDVFTEDVVCDYRAAFHDPSAPDPKVNPDDLLHGREAVLAYIRKGLTPIVSVHQGFTPEIELVTPNSAQAIWPMADLLVFPDSSISEIRGYGHYHETYRKIADQWLIATLRLTRLRVDFVSR